MLSEMTTFVWNNGRPESMRSYNDDLIMAASIACWVRDTALIENKKSVEYNKAFINTMTSNHTVLNTTIRGMPGHTINSGIADAAREQKKNMEQFPWLFKG